MPVWYKALIEPVSGLAVEVPGTFRFGNLSVTIPQELVGIAPEFTWFWKVAEFVPTPTNLSFHLRRDVKKVFDRDHTGEPFPGEWAFRAYATEDGKTIRVFVDHAETPESLKWIVLHEIGHVIVAANPGLRKVYRSRPKPLNYATNDDAHDAWPEEIACNDMANRLAPIPNLDRKWWRKRVSRS
jgi:hypothetical protein